MKMKVMNITEESVNIEVMMSFWTGDSFGYLGAVVSAFGECKEDWCKCRLAW